jgi:hypothetical protein
MSTKARLGIDILATNKTGAAFAAVGKNVSSIQKSLNSMKFLMAGFVTGNFLEGMMRSFVEVSKQAAPVKAALEGLSGSWGSFAEKVGESGLNDALINFANRMSGLIQGTSGLAQALGTLMGGAVNGMGRTFEVIGRAIGFVYDNLGFLTRAVGVYIGLRFGQQVAWTGLTILKFAATMRIGAIAMGLFTVATNMGKKGLLAMTAVGLAAALNMEAVTEVISATMENIERMMGPMFGSLNDGLKALGLDTSALTNDLLGFVAVGSKVKSVQGELGKGASDASLGVTKLSDSFSMLGMESMHVMTPMQEVMSQMQDMGSSIKSSLGTALSDLITGMMSVKDAFASMAQSIIQSMADMAAQLAINAGFKLLMSALGVGGGAGLSIGGIMIGGVRANGGPVSSGMSYLVGERGPEIFEPKVSGNIIPNHDIKSFNREISGRTGAAAPMNVTVNNYAGAEVKTRRNGDGRLEIDLLKRDLANDLARGGGILSDAIERGYGLRRAGR